jgi:hypothetical protein
LILFLCISLLAWRLDSRVEQYHHSSAGPRAVVAFFDANERNIASFDTAYSQPRCVAGDHDQLFFLARPETVLIQQPFSRERLETQTAPPDVFFYSAPHFPNPPPSLT